MWLNDGAYIYYIFYRTYLPTVRKQQRRHNDMQFKHFSYYTIFIIKNKIYFFKSAGCFLINNKLKVSTTQKR